MGARSDIRRATPMKSAVELEPSRGTRVAMMLARRSSSAMNVSSYQTLSESDLLQRLLTLEAAAWREFHRRYDRMIWTCVHRVVVRFNSVVASDAIQEIRGNFYASLLANDMHKLRRFEVERGNKLGSWIGLIAINATWDYLRASARRPVVDPMALAEELHDHSDLFAHQIALEDCDRLAHVVRALSPRDQEFVRLYYIDGLSPQEVADALGLNVKSVYTKKHRLTRQLREAFAAQRARAALPPSAPERVSVAA
jgi:RNA polymerase sigma-70 factor, ECF subfamily